METPYCWHDYRPNCCEGADWSARFKNFGWKDADIKYYCLKPAVNFIARQRAMLMHTPVVGPGCVKRPFLRVFMGLFAITDPQKILSGSFKELSLGPRPTSLFSYPARVKSRFQRFGTNSRAGFTRRAYVRSKVWTVSLDGAIEQSVPTILAPIGCRCRLSKASQQMPFIHNIARNAG